MIETAVFFLTITAALQFSTWAEGWLTSNARPPLERARPRRPHRPPPYGGERLTWRTR